MRNSYLPYIKISKAISTAEYFFKKIKPASQALFSYKYIVCIV